ncbi:ArpU family phage packaging/lysis transcriptional regulator [Companilactobacillus nantensis]|uniref:ArpU family phage packaging/lysis transcriptional regulator n=1 Tax=Companilactobacillus nantensis TaxID=305793 RepID=UPI00070D7205|nr:ArpU family phage packaging/lysis transcriptional regulator [Companilactobacillus nantensis]GEO63025.1 autolysin [Companilactobacillus nantensis]
MFLLPEINRNESRKNARKVLAQYRRLSRVAGRSLTDIKSPVITDMPKGSSFGNSQENMTADVSSARWEVEEIERAAATLSKECFEVIYFRYMSKEFHTRVEIASLVFGSLTARKTVERRQSEALLQFCESYRFGELLVYKKKKKDNVSV